MDLAITCAGAGDEADRYRPALQDDPQVAPASLAELCAACPVRQRAAFRPFEPGDLAFVQRSVVARRHFAPGADILRADEIGGLYTLWDGWGFRWREVPTDDGRAMRQQITAILLPGDVFGIEAALTGAVGSPARALTAATACVHDPRVFAGVFRDRPALARALMETAARDAMRMEAWVAVMGQGTGPQRAAWLMLELRDRLARRGMLPDPGADGVERVPFPLTRRHLAAALGMSGTHVARSLAELENAGLARLEGEELVIRDAARLVRLCGHVPAPDEAGRRALL